MTIVIIVLIVHVPKILNIVVGTIFAGVVGQRLARAGLFVRPVSAPLIVGSGHGDRVAGRAASAIAAAARAALLLRFEIAVVVVAAGISFFSVFIIPRTIITSVIF